MPRLQQRQDVTLYIRRDRGLVTLGIMKFCVLVVIQVPNQNIAAEVDNKQVLIVQQAALNGNLCLFLFSFSCLMLEQLITLGQWW